LLRFATWRDGRPARPDGEIDREARLGAVTLVISDPEHIDGHRRSRTSGGACRWRGRITRGPAGVLDMERIDPDAVEVPAWYKRNPHRASDVAFVLFTGEGASTRAHNDHEPSLGVVGSRYGSRCRVEAGRHVTA